MPWKCFTPKLHLTYFDSQPAISAWIKLTPEEKQLQHEDPHGALHGLPFQTPSSLGLMLFHPGPGEATCSFVAFRLPSQPTWPGRIAVQGKDGMNTLRLAELS